MPTIFFSLPDNPPGTSISVKEKKMVDKSSTVGTIKQTDHMPYGTYRYRELDSTQKLKTKHQEVENVTCEAFFLFAEDGRRKKDRLVQLFGESSVKSPETGHFF